MRRARPVAVLFCMFASTLVLSQDPPERSRVHCDPAGRQECPGPDCPCERSTLKVAFDGVSDTVFQYEVFTADVPIDAAVVLDVETDGIQGWSYGVAHDDAYLTLRTVTVDGTAAERAKVGGFVVADKVDIETCERDPDPRCSSPKPGAGFISAVILSFTETISLPLGAQKICRAGYTLKAEPGPNGTLIRFTDRLKKRGSPPVDINLTVTGRSTSPERLVYGWVKLIGAPVIEVCDNGADDDSDGRTDCDDVDCIGASACRPPSEVCDNGLDDDRDGRADCDDRDCAEAEACRPKPEVCDNGLDEDRDGRIDCEDADCVQFPRCIRESCLNGVDDDQDGAVDCADSECRDAVICRPEVCDNGVDDNANAMTDCYDPECKSFPACEPKPEICDNGLDEDFDGKFDCGDPDCKAFEACVPKPEVCNNRIDDDLDGRTDCRDRDCADDPACAPGPEVCDDCFDNDRDGQMDCEDPECATHQHCSPQPEVCDNLRDDDDDGLVDGADGDCAGGAALPLGACVDYAFHFGPEATTEDHRAPSGGFIVSLRNRSPVLAFRVCVSRDVAPAGAVYRISSGSALNDLGSLQVPVPLNQAAGSAGEVITGIERGSAIEGLAGWDFLSAQVAASDSTGVCFTADYVVDLNFTRPHGVIPPTRQGGDCSSNELLRVVTVSRPTVFRRAELDGAPGLGITDAVLIIHSLVTEARLPYDCRDAMDADDDGRVSITDPIVILRYLFQDGPPPAAPFESCGEDQTPELSELGCVESACS